MALTAAAVSLSFSWAPAPGLAAHTRAPTTDTRPRVQRPLVLLAAGTLPAGGVLILRGPDLALLLVLGGAAVGGLTLVGRSQVRRAADQRRARVVEACEALGSELRAGRSPLGALERATEVWPGLGPVVAACRLDADVPAALRRVARTPGAEDLEEAAAAWQLSQRLGAGLATALDRVTEASRAGLAARRVVAAELASAQATAWTVALLPVGVLMVSDGTGADPWHFLLRTAPGIGCLAAGLGLALAGLWWIDLVVARVGGGDP